MSNGYEQRVQRIRDAVALRRPDRVPVVPLLDGFPIRYAGMTQGESYRDKDAAFEAYLKTQRDFDLCALMKPNRAWVHLADRPSCPPYREKVPGVDIAEDDMIQVDEEELMSRDDLKRLADMGWNAFWAVRYKELFGVSLEEGRGESCRASLERYNRESAACKLAGFPALNGANIDDPTMAISMARTLTGFTMDIFEVPDLVDAAIQATVPDLIENAILAAEQTDGMVMWITMERCSGALYPLHVFERFLWPYMPQYVDAALDSNLIPWFHMDTDWTKNLPYFKDLPKGKCIMDLDSMTDIFNAKEVLQGHMCLASDVPATMFTLGTPEDITEYCIRLIDEVGDDGGLILVSGCEMPLDTKPENLHAMVNASKNKARSMAA